MSSMSYSTATRQLSGEDSSLSHASFGAIFGTGLLLGIVHVLTGPDHLSALAAMTTGSSWRAFSLGVRWGCGHSLGLLIMALIFFAAGKTIDLNHVGAYLNYVVGAFMIALGLWTARQVKRKYRDKRKEFAAVNSSSRGGAMTGATPPRPLEPMTTSERQISARSSGNQNDAAACPGLQLVVETKPHETVGSPSSISTPYHSVHVEDVKADLASLESASAHDGDDDAHLVRHDGHGHSHKLPKCCKNVSFSSPTAQRITALMVGIVHGIAGPGGILGVLPAVVMANWAKSTAYLASFCLSSIFIMGVFAALYGEITGRLGRNSLLIEFRIGIFSAAFSVVVGVGWILLQATGYMDKVFE